MPDSLTIKEILKERNLAPSKKLGQNFLIHKQTPAMIVQRAGVGSEETVVELGVGLGSLTIPLAASVKKVIGIELDAGIVKWQRESGNLPENVELHHQDLLKADFGQLAQQCGGRLKIMANLPYSISNPLIFKLIDNQPVMGWAVLMLQKEVAQRLTASVGSKEYGILSVLLGACASVETLLTVGPEQFHPRPKVDSQVVKIVFDPVPSRVQALPLHDPALLRQLVKGAFQQRRKTLLNSLSATALPNCGKAMVAEILVRADIDPKIRAERLRVEDFVRLANCVSDHLPR
ncbi:16S rRNA (adenine(1518)-N(6)/adenine(1519)-N(6))-dimethyltransferase RsmA [Thermodesulfobacteriota bacterium]